MPHMTQQCMARQLLNQLNEGDFQGATHMKPVVIFRHTATEGPGYLASFLDAHHIPWKLIRIDVGDAVPENYSEFGGLVFMGGPMSVNDDLPWIPKVLKLIQGAVAADVPGVGALPWRATDVKSVRRYDLRSSG